MRAAYLLAPLVLVLIGCSNHPLVDDVTDYSTYEIVQKLRCEAQSAILSELDERGLEPYRERGLDLKAEIKVYKEWRASNNTLLDKIDEEVQDNDTADKANKKLLKDLKSKSAVLLGEAKFLKAKLDTATSDSDKESLRFRIGKLFERATILAAKVSETSNQNDKIAGEIAETRMQHDVKLRKLRMTQQAYLDRKKHMKDVSELFDAVVPESQILKELFPNGENTDLREIFAINRTTISMKLDFKITEKNNAIADGTVTWPIHLGALSLISKAGREKARDAQRVVQITSTFQELSDRRTLDCSDASRQPGDKRARTYPITGNVGIGELIDQYFQILRGTIALATGQDTFTDTLQFTTKISGKINPTIEIKPVSPSLVKAGLDLNAERTDLHQVAVLASEQSSVRLSDSSWNVDVICTTR